MMARESDHLIVLGGRESRLQGEGGDGGTEPSPGNVCRTCRAGVHQPTTIRGIARSGETRMADASLIEEPGAGILHAGICAGGIG